MEDLSRLPGLPPLLRRLKVYTAEEVVPEMANQRFVAAPELGTNTRLLQPFYKGVTPPPGRGGKGDV